MKAGPGAPAQSGIHRKTQQLPRGRLHADENLDPRKTARIVVDMQNGFCVEKSRPLRRQIHRAT